MVANSTSAQQTTRQVGALTVTRISDTQAELRRELNAPRRLVFEALSSCEHIQHWWGPRNTSFINCAMDFRQGGQWRFVIRDSDGNEAAFRGEYREIAPPDRVVQTFEFEGFPGAIAVESMTLEEHDGKTSVKIISSLDSKEAADAYLASGMEQGAAETYDRLEEYIRTLA